MTVSNKKLPLLWFLTGTIGDALMALALTHELAELNPGITSTMLVRRDPRLVEDLAKLVPSVRVVEASFTLASFVQIARALTQPWQIMSAWKSVGLRNKLRALFLPNPKTRLVRFDMHRPATPHDAVAPYDMQKLVIDNFRVMAQTIGLNTKAIGSLASLPIAAAMPKGYGLTKGSYIVLHPFGSNEVKSLPRERARSIIRALAAAYPELSFVITGGASDTDALRALAEGLPRTQIAAGLPILEVAGLIESAVLYIGVDTGITHLAAMMGKNVLALEHPTFPRWYPTYNPKTTLLLSATDERQGVWGISDEEVLKASSTILQS